MARAIANAGGGTYSVSNGDRVVLDLPANGSITVEQGRGYTRDFRIDFGDDDDIFNRVIVDIDSFDRDGLQILVVGYETSDIFEPQGAQNILVEVPTDNQNTFEYGPGFAFSGTAKTLDPRERDLTDEPPTIIICIAGGAIIETDLGPRLVESLLEDGGVKTVDSGFQEELWIGRRHLNAETLARNSHLRPVRIAAGSMGQYLPRSDIVVSPQHRICVNVWHAELCFGHEELLAPAKSFLELEGVDVLEASTGTHFYLLFERHELL